MLDALARAYMRHRMFQDRAIDRPTRVKIRQAAVRNPRPVEDRRLLITTVTFSVGLVAIALLTILIRLVLMQSKSIFGSENEKIMSALDKSA